MNTQDHKQALPLGFRLGSYRVVRVLGAGGFGVTYLCEHGGLGVMVAVKEYLPSGIAVRTGNVVVPKSPADREGYQWGLNRFLDEARTLARFEHRNVVRVRDVFEANRTAYIVMDYEDGEPLDRVLERKGTLTEAQLKRMLLPIVDGLRQVHAAGFLHRDVKPPNIFIRHSDQSPVLLDFGAARQALGRLSRSVTVIASAGYSPPEQYESNGEQGPWTDIYALSALCYRAISGKTPVEALRRQGRLLRGEDDPLPKLADVAGERCSPTFLAAVDRGLRVVEGERPQSLEEWQAEIGGRVGSAQKPAKPPEADAPTREGADQEAITDQEMIHGMTLAWHFIEGGARRFEDYAKQMAEALGEAFNAYRPYLRLFYESTRHAPASTDWCGEMTPLAELDALERNGSMEMLLAHTTWLREAAERGEAEAQFRLALRLRAMSGRGEELVHAHRQAVLWFRKAAEQGHAGAQGALGSMYGLGQGVAQDHRHAALWFRKAAEQGHPHGEYVLGSMYSSGQGVAQDHREAAIWFRRAAEHGHADAQCALGEAYGKGQGVVQDYRQAARWFRRAAGQGHTFAQGALGAMYAAGEGVAQDHQQAALWCRKAAEQGHALAQCALGGMYGVGQGVAQDHRQAELWYRKAAEQGHADAQNNLGAMYDSGVGVTKDPRQAALWFRKAAEQGLPPAQYNLAVSYAYGKGVPKDTVQAYAWMNLAAAQGLTKAVSDRAVMEEVMTLGELTEAQSLCRELARHAPS